MQRYWDVLDEREVGGYKIRIKKTWEDVHPGDCFDESAYDIADICNRIDRGDLDWFVLCVEVLVEDHVIADACCGGLLYEDAREVLTDGIADDLILDATHLALERTHYLAQKYTMLSLKHSGVDSLAV